MNDEQVLIRRILQGDLRAFRHLVEQYQRLVAHMVGRIVQQPEDVEDLCQEVFIQVHKHLGEFGGESKLSTWIATIAYRTALNHRKKTARRPADPLSEPLADRLEDAGQANPEERLVRQDRQRFMQEEIARLPVHYRTILTLYHLEELSYEEIGAVTSLPEGTVKNYLFRARKLLKEALQRYQQSERWP
ncbi:RNA polymerase sigma factor [Larkinella soli]|uniref:RNA polymerase sigma factor n=1 Tax=Larkinella soli TaxID=1770527 RepID=UPI000FFB5897|nr:RNA polymerase sigma factor [Larkinella soli]